MPPPRITLTFDNGPHERVTPLVLDVLKQHDVLGTFFMLGKYLDQPFARPLMQRAVQEGALAWQPHVFP